VRIQGNKTHNLQPILTQVSPAHLRFGVPDLVAQHLVSFSLYIQAHRLRVSAPDWEGVCRLLNLYILVASWIIPVLRA
jgi:hypothetical protein